MSFSLVASAILGILESPPRLDAFFMIKAGFLFLCCLCLAGCAGGVAPPLPTYGMEPTEIQTKTFRLYSLQRQNDPAGPVTIYIEGDGHAWIDKYTPSPDPTPHKGIARRLATLDPAPNVVYLARPCQYITNDPTCKTEVWTNKRYAQRNIQSMTEAVRQIAPEGRDIHLVAFSGGAVIAAQLAVKLKNVQSLRTIAGNLDTKTLAAYHGVPTFDDAPNPVDSAASLRDLPQAHWFSDRDAIVPPVISRFYLSALGAAPCAMFFPETEPTHDEGWEPIWAKALADNPLDHCRSNVPPVLFVLSPD